MSKVNVIMAVNQVTWNALKKNFQYDTDGNRLRTDLTVNQAKKLRNNITGYWKTPTLAGTVYHVVSWMVDNVPTAVDANDLKWVEFLTGNYPNKFHIIGAWNDDGTQFGTKLIRTENGVDLVDEYVRVPVFTNVEVVDIEATIVNQAVTMKTVVEETYKLQLTGQQVEVPHYYTTVEGVPTYPIHAQYMAIFPDDITYDETGNEVSRVVASLPKEVNNISGWKERRWS